MKDIIFLDQDESYLVKAYIDIQRDCKERLPEAIMLDEAFANDPKGDPLPELTSKIRSRIGSFNNFIASLNGKEPDSCLVSLASMDLEGFDLREGDFSFVNFDDANLRGASLEGAKLRGANFVKTDLREANLKNTDLSLANMADTDLRSADLENSDISGANMLETLIIGAKNIPKLSGVQQKDVIDTQEKVDSKIAYLEGHLAELKKIDEMERLSAPKTFEARIMNERQVYQVRTA